MRERENVCVCVCVCVCVHVTRMWYRLGSRSRATRAPAHPVPKTTTVGFFVPRCCLGVVCVGVLVCGCRCVSMYLRARGV